MQREDINHIYIECQQFLNRVTALTDRAAWQELAACYTPDAVLYRPSDPETGVVGREAILASFLARPQRTTCHMLANCIFEVQSPQQVVATSRVLLLSGEAAEVVPVRADSTMMVGSFVDTLQRIDEQWFIQCRRGGIELKYDYQ